MNLETLNEIRELLANRQEQLNKESYQSYNYGYVAGQISGIEKVIAILNKESGESFVKQK